ncbi:response regulator [Flavobacterium sp. UMI-01]|uniref:response regulator n=1 Tax=Flavobacterium sp. UMI-01 TaxID=1441053 RepID=UPI001C7CE4AD|nr:response regulator [Flavobacterium sp. UMI-01]GIZ10137.1 response regulator [Flavobacterium sp. UMI-01]
MSNLNIFYADDDEDDLMFFSDAVESISNTNNAVIKLHIHRNGEKLVDKIKELNSANGVVFLDLNMPKKSGFQFLEEIRNESVIKKFPVIIYSTSSNKNDINRSLQLGANFYAVKPYKFDDLQKMILAILNIDWYNHKVDINNFILI